MRNYIKILVLVFISLNTSEVLKAQDPHLSQWQVSPMLMNAAQTGYIPNAQMRISANYRSQWASLGNNISTMALSFDKNKVNTPWSYGGYILNNNLADVFNNTALVGSVAYEITEPNNGKYHIMGGIQLGLIYKKFDITRLIFDNQWNDGNFDADLPSGEILNNQSRLLPETAIGMFYYNDNKEHALRPYAGFGLNHLTQPKENFLGGDITNLPLRWNATLGAKWFKDEYLTLSPYAMYMVQGTATEKIGGFTTEYKFKDTEYRAMLDLGYRVDDAVIIQAGFYLRDNWYRISYDVNVSPLKEYTGGRNAIEFSVTFTPEKGFLKKAKVNASNMY